MSVQFFEKNAPEDLYVSLLDNYPAFFVRL